MSSGWNYTGPVPVSKSIMNRALLVQSHFPKLYIHGDSDADDVMAMRKALESFKNKQPIDCQKAGTVLRFMAVRAAREQGEYILKGHERLFQRRPQDLTKTLMQLGCDVDWGTEQLKIRSYGFRLMGDGVHVPVSHTSQLATSVLLNAWNSPFNLIMYFESAVASRGYFDLSVKMARRLGMEVETTDKGCYIKAGQKVLETQWTVEPDLSCAFAVAAMAALNGRCDISPFPVNSLQPDAVFIDILEDMAVETKIQPVPNSSSVRLTVLKSDALEPIDVDLGNSPDLFPVLAVLCAFAEGRSRLHGAPHLADKESDRIQAVAVLFKAMGVKFEILKDGMIIHGKCKVHNNAISFDPQNDHRMVMAAALAQSQGFNIRIEHADVVNKSFPGFLQLAGVV